MHNAKGTRDGRFPGGGMAAWGAVGDANQKVVEPNPAGGVLSRAPSTTPGGRLVPGGSAAGAPNHGAVNNPHRTLPIIVYIDTDYITQNNGGIAHHDARRQFQRLPIGPCVCRYQKPRSGGTHRWKCFMASPEYNFMGEIRTDTRPAGALVLETGALSETCDRAPWSTHPKTPSAIW